MKNQNTKKLIDFIKRKGYVTIDQVKAEAFNIDRNWGYDTVKRTLRNYRKTIKHVRKENGVKNSPIIAYKYLGVSSYTDAEKGKISPSGYATGQDTVAECLNILKEHRESKIKPQQTLL